MRDFAQIRLSIWNDDDFRALTPPAQHLYFILISHHTLSYCGVGDWRPGRLAAQSSGWTRDAVNEAAAELIDRLFIVVDEDTEEFLVRSFVRNDPLMKQKNLGTSMARAFAGVTSQGIRGVIVGELLRLRDESPNLAGWKSEEAVSLLSKRDVDPSTYPCGNPQVKGHVDPSVDPYIDPSVKGQWRGYVDPSVDPSPTTATTTSTFNQVGGKVINLVTTAREPDPSPFHFSEFENDFHPWVEDSDDDPEPDPTGPEVAATPTPDQWSTAADPRCQAHAHLPRNEVPKCRECANVREWFEGQDREAVRVHRQEVADCQWCDHRGLVEAHDPQGRPVVIQCDHRHPPQPLEDPVVAPHVELTDRAWRRKLIEEALGTTPKTRPTAPHSDQTTPHKAITPTHTTNPANSHTGPERKTA